MLGTVTDATGDPVAGIHVDVWNEGGTALLATTLSGPGGSCLVPVAAGSHRVSTDNNHGYEDQVYDGVACPDGSAFSGRCDASAGTLVEVLTNTRR